MLWDKIAAIVIEEYPDVKRDKVLGDAMPTRVVLHPETLVTSAAMDSYVDILSNLAASLMGVLVLR